jgi:GT2 family glycosyltransferase
VPDLSVVIPTLHRLEKLARVLDRLEKQSVAADRFEVVIACDAAEDKLEEIDALARRRPYEVRRLSAARPGASAARNAGWRAADARIVLFLDNDVLPEGDLVAEHLAWHAEHPSEEVGILGHVRWARELRVTTFMRWVENGLQFDYPNIRGTDAGWGRFYTANASVKRALLDRVDGFDEVNLPFGYEDLEIAYRMSKAGFRLLYARGASAEHLHAMTLEMWKKRMPRAAYSERQFCSMYPEIPPYFLRMFESAAAHPPARTIGVRLAPLVPRSTPWLGERVWNSIDLDFKQALAPHFLRAWREAAAPDRRTQPQGYP